MTRPTFSARRSRCRGHAVPAAIAAATVAIALLCQAGGPALAAAAEQARTPLEKEQESLAGYFKAMADAFGLTAELQRRCKQAPQTVAELRNDLMKNGQEIQRAARTKVSLKDVAAAGFDDGMKRGRGLECSQESFNLAQDARKLMEMRVNESFGRIKEMLQQGKKPSAPRGTTQQQQ